jgi:hypothetical protein
MTFPAGAANLKSSSWAARTKRDLIIEVWEALDCESVGAQELEKIQQALKDKFGDNALESPASIARIVADEGAVLRHPEVFKFDATWRASVLIRLTPPESLSFANLSEASESIRKLESWRKQFADEGKRVESEQLRVFALKAKEELNLVVRSRVFDTRRRREAKEIAQWLTLWMQDPAIFDDWLDLRKRSAEFVERFQV